MDSTSHYANLKKKYIFYFRRKYPYSTALYKEMIQNTVSKLCSMGSELYKKKPRKRYILTEEKLDAIGTSSEASPKSPYIFWSSA
jgi:hypothetical protein